MGARGVARWRALLVVAWACSAAARTLCPSRCACDDALRSASCAAAGLDIVPIQLNPEATHINLTQNSINNLLYTLTLYTQLTVLDMSYNKIQDLGNKNFEYNTDMVQLNVSHNMLKKLERDTFVGLKRLLDMNLADNEILTVHAQSFKDLSVLERLDLSNNKLVNFESDTFKPLVSLKMLSLKNNAILNIPSGNLIFIQQLEILDLSENLIQQVAKHGIPFLKELKHLDLNSNIIYDIDPLGFHNLPSLRHLDMSDNNMTSVPTPALSKLSNLSHLYLSGNFFQNLTVLSFQSLFHLRHLHLSRSYELERIDARAFVDNINLQKIWLNENIKIREVPPRLFHGNPKLSHVFMRNNALETLEASHFPIDRLQELQISGNPFVCNCSLLWLWKLGRDYNFLEKTNRPNESSILKIDYEELRCAAPEPLRNAMFIHVQEREIGCSSGWVIVAIVVLTVSIVISAAGGALYFLGPLKKCKGDKSKQVMTSVMLNGDVSKLGNGLVYSTRGRDQESKRDADRYLMIGSSVSNNFHSLNPPWHSVDKNPYMPDSEEHIYQQFTYETIPHHRTPEKPHIVYV